MVTGTAPGFTVIVSTTGIVALLSRRGSSARLEIITQAMAADAIRINRGSRRFVQVFSIAL